MKPSILCGTLFSDMRRAFLSGGFLFGLIAIPLLFLFCVFLGTSRPQIDVLSLWQVARNSAFPLLQLPIATLPFALSFCADWEHQYLRSLIIRTSLKKYAFSKVLVCVLSAAACVVLGTALFWALCSFWMPWISSNNIDQQFFYGMETSVFGVLLTSGNYAAFFGISLLTMGLNAAFWSVVTLSVTTIIPNRFLAVAFPIIGHYTLVILQQDILHLPRIIQVYDVFSLTAGGIQAPLPALFYMLAYGILLCSVFGCLFSSGVRRRLNNG